MHEAVAVEAPNRKRSIVTLIRASVPTLAEVSLTIASALLLILSFPDFDLWFLAWIGLAPLIMLVVLVPNPGRAFLLGLLWGTVFFYGTCWWLTYPMIHYGHISPWLAYPLFFLPIVLVALFPALFCFLLARIIAQFGLAAIFAAPLLWVACEWLRYAVTGQLWNALGYSQAFHPWLIQSARWGGVYAVGFLLLLANCALASLLMRSVRVASALIITTALFAFSASYRTRPISSIEANGRSKQTFVIAVQPNVPMEGVDDSASMQQLLNRHLELSARELSAATEGASAVRLVVWPESPMNFSYSRDSHLRDIVANFARTNHTSVLLNSLEPAPNGGDYNSAIMINEEGRIVAQYDKIRLMPFGEYVPLPHWLPGASSVRGIVGDFTPGSSYTLMPLGAFRAGVFICIEAAHPGVARTFTNEGADVLINISNDGYLGPTPVMRQHLSNAIFRAAENGRPLIRVTNAGISAYIDSNGAFRDATPGFEQAVRTWTITEGHEGTTFYTRHGDLFVYACALISLGFASAAFMTKGKRFRNSANRRG
jgi:apolipoprotein N-acyltransferase